MNCIYDKETRTCFEKTKKKPTKAPTEGPLCSEKKTCNGEDKNGKCYYNKYTSACTNDKPEGKPACAEITNPKACTMNCFYDKETSTCAEKTKKPTRHPTTFPIEGRTSFPTSFPTSRPTKSTRGSLITGASLIHVPQDDDERYSEWDSYTQREKYVSSIHTHVVLARNQDLDEMGINVTQWEMDTYKDFPKWSFGVFEIERGDYSVEHIDVNVANHFEKDFDHNWRFPRRERLRNGPLLREILKNWKKIYG